jgi:plastocyanin
MRSVALAAMALTIAATVSATGGEATDADSGPVVVIKDHVFQPAEIHVAAGEVIYLTVDNQDPTPEEFESSELRVEKIIPGGLSGMVRFGPLEPGTYPFFGEFNQATAQGKVIAE